MLNFKKQKGFTLVEVIVVAVIVAALAAVAVGVYINYVGAARDNAARNAGSAIASFCGACANAEGVLTMPAASPITAGGQIACASASQGNSTIQVPIDIDVAYTGIVTGSVITVNQEDRTLAAHKFNYNF